MTAAVDLYPTRRQDQPRWHERIDPIVYRRHEREAPLTAQQIARFERDGFLLLPNAFSAEEVAVFRREVERLRSDKGILASDAAIREPDSGALRSLFAIHQSSELFAKVAADKRIAAKVQHLLDGDLYVHQSRLNLKPGFKGKEFYWHSDFETWHAEDGLPRMRTISCSILLTDNSPFNGPLLLVPGSHRHFIGCVGETPQGITAARYASRSWGYRMTPALPTWSARVASPPQPARPARWYCLTATRCTAPTAILRRIRAATCSTCTTTWIICRSSLSGPIHPDRHSWPNAAR